MVIFTGIGGGFMERDNVEYIRRDDSDDEYDEVSSICFFNFMLFYTLCFS